MKSQHRKLPTHVHSYVQLEQQPHPLGSGLPTAPSVHWPLPGLDWGPRAGAAGQGALWHLGHRLLLQALQGQCASHPKNTKLNLLNLFLRPHPLPPRPPDHPAPWEKLLPLGESGHPPHVNRCLWPTYLMKGELTVASLLKTWNCAGVRSLYVCVCARAVTAWPFMRLLSRQHCKCWTGAFVLSTRLNGDCLRW